MLLRWFSVNHINIYGCTWGIIFIIDLLSQEGTYSNVMLWNDQVTVTKKESVTICYNFSPFVRFEHVSDVLCWVCWNILIFSSYKWSKVITKRKWFQFLRFKKAAVTWKWHLLKMSDAVWFSSYWCNWWLFVFPAENVTSSLSQEEKRLLQELEKNNQTFIPEDDGEETGTFTISFLKVDVTRVCYFMCVVFVQRGSRTRTRRLLTNTVITTCWSTPVTCSVELSFTRKCSTSAQKTGATWSTSTGTARRSSLELHVFVFTSLFVRFVATFHFFIFHL